MKKIKDFFDKKQSETKFKKAGAGYKLSSSSQKPTNATSAGPSTSVPYSSRKAGPDSNVASAALARFEGKNPSNKAAIKPTLHDIMAEEKKKITDEIRLKEELKETKSKNLQKLEEQQKNPYKEFNESQLFSCSALELSPMHFDELICKIKAKIFDDFADDPILRAAMTLFNCNRSISKDKVRLQSCLEILTKIVQNLQTENIQELEKFKKIRRSKIEQKVLSLDGALDFLFAIGFTVDDDAEWLSYAEQDEDLQTKMQYVLELLLTPQVIPIELDHQVKHITGEEGLHQTLDEDLNLTSKDFKDFYANLEKNRQINEMLISKETKSKLISNTSSFKPLFTKLRFKFCLVTNDVEIIEAVFYSDENLLDIKEWFITNYSQLFEGKEISFKVGPDKFSDEQLSKTLQELKLSPASTLIVFAK